MMGEKCHKCKHYILEYAPYYKAFIEGCDAEQSEKNEGCKNAYGPKERPKAFIRRSK